MNSKDGHSKKSVDQRVIRKGAGGATSKNFADDFLLKKMIFDMIELGLWKINH